MVPTQASRAATPELKKTRMSGDRKRGRPTTTSADPWQEKLCFRLIVPCGRPVGADRDGQLRQE